MKASLKHYRQSPRKVRLVADAVRGKSVADAEVELTNLAKKSSPAVLKVIKSATANAISTGKAKNEGELKVKTIEISKGITFKRGRPRARGSMSPIHKHTSHINVELGVNEKVEEKKKTNT